MTTPCSTQRDEIDSPYHAIESTDRPANTAERFALACLKDVLPEDMQTQEDFGFSAFCSSEDQAKLLGLYLGLLGELLLNVPTRTLHRWQVDGTLYDDIEKTYMARPRDPPRRIPCLVSGEPSRARKHLRQTYPSLSQIHRQSASLPRQRRQRHRPSVVEAPSQG